MQAVRLLEVRLLDEKLVLLSAAHISKDRGRPCQHLPQAIDHLQLNGVFLHPPDLERFCEKDNEQLYLALHFDDVPHLPVVDLPQPVEGAQPRDGTLLSIFQRWGKHKNDMALYHCSKTRYRRFAAFRGIRWRSIISR